MWDLRWVLLGLGALVVVGVYLWTKSLAGRSFFPETLRRKRSEPSFGDDAGAVSAPPDPSVPIAAEPARKPTRSAPDRVITLRLIPRSAELNTERAVAALTGAGLEHGRYGIFHRDGVAANEQDATIAGLSFFIVLPGIGDPVARFDAMVETARALSVELQGDLHDERGSSWSVQRERYLREEIIEYKHQAERH